MKLRSFLSEFCASELIGSVIGKSGANVKRVEHQTGAHIKVQEVDKDVSEERIIIVSSKEVMPMVVPIANPF